MQVSLLYVGHVNVVVLRKNARELTTTTTFTGSPSPIPLYTARRFLRCLHEKTSSSIRITVVINYSAFCPYGIRHRRRVSWIKWLTVSELRNWLSTSPLSFRTLYLLNVSLSACLCAAPTSAATQAGNNNVDCLLIARLLAHNSCCRLLPDYCVLTEPASYDTHMELWRRGGGGGDGASQNHSPTTCCRISERGPRPLFSLRQKINLCNGIRKYVG